MIGGWRRSVSLIIASSKGNLELSSSKVGSMIPELVISSRRLA